MKTLRERILGILEKSEEALTYGEVLAKYLYREPYFASLATNAFCSWKDTSKLGLFFENYEDDGLKISRFYSMQLLPALLGLEKEKRIVYIRTNPKKRYATHSNFVADEEEKIYKRLEKEFKRKVDIKPTLISIAKEIAKEVKEEYPKEVELAIVCGSSSEKNSKPFIYYGDSELIKSVSDLDITFFASKPISLKKFENLFEEISRSRKILLNPVARFYDPKNYKGQIEKGLSLI